MDPAGKICVVTAGMAREALLEHSRTSKEDPTDYLVRFRFCARGRRSRDYDIRVRDAESWVIPAPNPAHAIVVMFDALEREKLEEGIYEELSRSISWHNEIHEITILEPDAVFQEAYEMSGLSINEPHTRSGRAASRDFELVRLNRPVEMLRLVGSQTKAARAEMEITPAPADAGAGAGADK